MNKQLVTVLTLLTVGAVLFSAWQPQADLEQTRYLEYLQEFRKPVPRGNELLYRTRIFTAALGEIEAHNADPSQTYKMGVNQFSDLTKKEFVTTYLGELADEQPRLGFDFSPEANVGFEGDIDWRKAGIITSVKNQGQCGSCWAFAATAEHESYQILVKKEANSLNLAEQQLVDCSGSYGNNGCNGGLASSAMKYIKDHGQVETKDYIYTAKTESCKVTGGRYNITSVSMESGCPALEARLTQGPSAVRVDASNWSRYSSGIFSNCDVHTNHAVQAVGTSQDSWTIKNSWGTSWGENGYIRLAKGNTCNVCYGPSFPA